MAGQTAISPTEKELNAVMAGAAASDPEAAEAAAEEAWKEFEAAEKGESQDAVDDDDRTDDARQAADDANQDTERQDISSDNRSGENDDDTSDTSPSTETGQQPDIWGNASPEQRAAYEAAQNEVKKATEFSNRMRGQVSGLNRKVQELQQQIAHQSAADKTADNKQGDDTEAEEDFFATEEWTDFAEEYPEIAGPFKKALGARSAENETLKAELATLKGELSGISSDHRATNLAEQVSIAYEAHPDYDQIAGSDSFRDWYERAPAYIRAGVERNAENIVDGNEVAHIVRLFKQETGVSSAEPSADANGGQKPNKQPLQNKRQRQMESAASPSTRGPGAVANGISEDPEVAWKQFEKLGL